MASQYGRGGMGVALETHNPEDQIPLLPLISWVTSDESCLLPEP